MLFADITFTLWSDIIPILFFGLLSLMKPTNFDIMDFSIKQQREFF